MPSFLDTPDFKCWLPGMFLSPSSASQFCRAEAHSMMDLVEGTRNTRFSCLMMVCNAPDVDTGFVQLVDAYVHPCTPWPT